MAVTPAVLAASTLSALSAAVIFASSSAFLSSTAFSFSARFAVVKLLSPAISAFSSVAAFARSAFAAVLSASKSTLGTVGAGITTSLLIFEVVAVIGTLIFVPLEGKNCLSLAVLVAVILSFTLKTSVGVHSATPLTAVIVCFFTPFT